MSIHVTMTGNPVNVRRGRIVLSDLDQIKKNERDRRRRLRLEQVCAFVENFQIPLAPDFEEPSET